MKFFSIYTYFMRNLNDQNINNLYKNIDLYRIKGAPSWFLHSLRDNVGRIATECKSASIQRGTKEEEEEGENRGKRIKPIQRMKIMPNRSIGLTRGGLLFPCIVLTHLASG